MVPARDVAACRRACGAANAGNRPSHHGDSILDQLFDPARHEVLAGPDWDPDIALGAIERIVADTRAAASAEGLWPAHPKDADPGAAPLLPLYHGAAGVIWALLHLEQDGAVAPGQTFATHLAAIEAANRAVLDTEAERKLLGENWQTRSWLLGDCGVQFTRWKAAPSEALLVELSRTIADNSEDAALELMWGAPGTMLAALNLYRRLGEPRWADLYRAGAAAVTGAFKRDEATGPELWTQTLYGRRSQYLGPVHGFAGNVYALAQGRDLMPSDAWSDLSRRFARTLEALAMRGPAGLNWPPMTGWEARGLPPLTQHCHGAPGMVTALAGLDAPIDDLLIGGGELTWAAGPLTKGANLCHGTSGNGFAFLKLFQRTGDEMWLSRARAFAMHAILQSDTEAAALGRRRYSLWTGDLGLACMLWECLQATARFPTLDVL